MRKLMKTRSKNKCCAKKNNKEIKTNANKRQLMRSNKWQIRKGGKAKWEKVSNKSRFINNFRSN